jgi:hypothetical protein
LSLILSLILSLTFYLMTFRVTLSFMQVPKQSIYLNRPRLRLSLLFDLFTLTHISMQMTIERRIGRNSYQFTVDGSNLFEAIKESENLAFTDVQACGCCGSDNIELTAREPHGYKYASIRCNDCKAQANFGQRRDNPKTFFLKKREGSLAWDKYEPQEA